jgi:catechol 2,3-dioxygenase-like lactoylglutathione lyase family enzyme
MRGGQVSLSRCPLLYVFYETLALERQRKLFESVIGLPVIEIDPRQPGHRHGVVKYDAGNVIISLNLSTGSRFRVDRSDALVTVFAVGPTWDGGQRLTDGHGHHYAFRLASPGGPARRASPAVDELRLTVEDLAAAVAFYDGVLGLEPLGQEHGAVRFATRTVPLVLERGLRAADGRRPRHDTYLLVFHTDDIEQTRASLAARGLTFKSRNIGSRDIGETIRFEDPAGHRFCLYQPSAESLTWNSGRKVEELGRR